MIHADLLYTDEHGDVYAERQVSDWHSVWAVQDGDEILWINARRPLAKHDMSLMPWLAKAWGWAESPDYPT